MMQVLQGLIDNIEPLGDSFFDLWDVGGLVLHYDLAVL